MDFYTNQYTCTDTATENAWGRKGFCMVKIDDIVILPLKYMDFVAAGSHALTLWNPIDLGG